MHLPKRKRLCFIIKSNFNAKKEISFEKWSEICLQIQNLPYDQILTSWTKNLDSQNIPENCKNGDELSEIIHQKLDTLPVYGPHEYLLDILWITDDFPKKCIELYGALKRSVEWHGASLFIVSDSIQENSKYVKDLRANIISNPEKLGEILNEKLYWRGSLAIFDDETMRFQNIGLHQNFELSSTFEMEPDLLKNVQLSQRLKIIAKCDLATIPAFYFTKSKLILKIANENNELINNFFKDKTMFENGNCLIAKLERHETKNNMGFRVQKSNARTTDNWKRAVLANNYKLELDQDWSGKALFSTYFVIFHDSFSKSQDSKLEKICIVLNPEAPLAAMAKSYEVLRTNHESPIDVITEAEIIENPPDLADLQDFINETTEEVVKEMKKRNPDKVYNDSELTESAMQIVRKHLQDQLQVTTVQVPDPKDCVACNSKNSKSLHPDNSRLFDFLRFFKQQEKDQKSNLNAAQTSTMMTPSGDYVVLEAKEMLKHFTAQGLPAKAKNLESLNPVKSTISKNMTMEKLKFQTWPEVLLTEFHDLYYNKTDSSEKNDDKIAKIQQMYIGAKETASTCHGLNSQQTVVVKPAKPLVNKNVNKTELRRTPRKSVPSNTNPNKAQVPVRPALPKDPDAIFRQKLRGAVYDALEDLKINEKDALFRPCFKKLFDICKVYAKDIPKTISTKKYLAIVAKEHAERVISIEKALRNSE